MPDLRDYADGIAAESAYLDKTIIYVEGKTDDAFLNRLLGPATLESHEFKRLDGTNGGCGGVVTRVAEERRVNAKIFGLLDGEAAAAYGHIDALVLAVENILFKVDDAEMQAILFLAYHELENISLVHGDTIEILRRNVPFAKYDTMDPLVVSAKLVTMGRRHFLASTLKYAAAAMRESTGCSIPSTGRFLEDVTAKTAYKAIAAGLAAEGDVSLSTLTRKVLEISTAFRQRVRDDGLNLDHVRGRMADGKGLSKAIRREFSINANWEGHLVHSVMRSDYPGRFREAVLSLVGQDGEPIEA